jgi:Bifunctional DNA primase/polymerase, N-terminal/Primase C terminal 1 (PriCT-1)
MEVTSGRRSQQPSTLLERALFLSTHLGWRVFPVHNPDTLGNCSCLRPNCTSVGKHPRTVNGLKDATSDANEIRNMWEQWPNSSIGVLTGAESGIFVVDIDPRHGGDNSLSLLQSRFGSFPKTVTSCTGGGGFHYVFRHPGFRVRNIQVNSNLGPGIDIRGDGGYIVAPPSLHASQRRYEWRSLESPLASAPDWLLNLLDQKNREQPRADDQIFAEGRRNASLVSIAGTMRNRGMSETSIGVALAAENQLRCEPPLPQDEVDGIVQSIMRYTPANPCNVYIGNAIDQGPQLGNAKLKKATWPTLKPEALQGLAGEFVNLVEPHTESDPVALLIQFLVAFGSVVGRNAYYSVEATKHFTNLFCVLVGKSNHGRKGTSWEYVRRLFESLDGEWGRDCLPSGLSTGEGLIYAVRDASEESKPIKDSGRHTGTYETVITDAGVADKRALVVEGEFVRVLRVQGRDGNTLSATLRTLWDSGNARSLVKSSPIRTSDAHVSVIGHITNEELKRSLPETDMFNGYANRFLWVCVKRSKLLPHGGTLVDSDLAAFSFRLQGAIEFAKHVGQTSRDPESNRIWSEVYPRLTVSATGVFGSIIARAAPQVVRLSIIYALLDGSETVRVEHLNAALALWSYCEDSARYIFGEKTGDRIADTVLAALRSTQGGLTRTEIVNLLGRNVSSSRLDESLHVLAEAELITKAVERAENAIRPTERWLASSGCSQSLGSDHQEVADAGRSGETSLNSYNSSPILTNESREVMEL